MNSMESFNMIISQIIHLIFELSPRKQCICVSIKEEDAMHS